MSTPKDLYSVQPDNKHLHAVKVALQRAKSNYGDSLPLKDRLIQYDLCLDMAWGELEAFLQEKHGEALSPRETEELSALSQHAVQQAIALSKGFVQLAEGPLVRAHQNEGFFESVLRYLQLDLNKDSIHGVDFEDDDDDPGIVQEMRQEFGVDSPMIHDGFGTARMAGRPEDEIQMFDDTTAFYTDAAHHLKQASNLFAKHYDLLKRLVGRLDEKGGGQGNQLLGSVRNQILAVKECVDKHLDLLDDHIDYHNWIGGSTDFIVTPFPGTGRGYCAYKHPQRALQEVLEELRHHSGRQFDLPGMRVYDPRQRGQG